MLRLNESLSAHVHPRYIAINRTYVRKSAIMYPMDYGNPVEALIPGVQGRVLAVLARTEAELTMRSVAEMAGASANQATVVLNRLVGLGLVERREVGAAALVRLIRENEAARSVLELVDLRQGVLDRLKGEAKKIRPAPTCLAVFGSFALGEAHEGSDVDILVVPPPAARPSPTSGPRRSVVGQIGRAGSPAIRSILSKRPWRSCRHWSDVSERRGGRLSMRPSYSSVPFRRNSTGSIPARRSASN
jgi:DNA-binding MarR family transcriptional regulator